MSQRARSEAFTLTPNHIKLLQAMYVNWQDCETGAPEIDPKRPYGNSDVTFDVHLILGWPYDYEDDAERDAACARAMAIHRETATALQIVLLHGFVPGLYRKQDKYCDRSWVLVSDYAD